MAGGALVQLTTTTKSGKKKMKKWKKGQLAKAVAVTWKPRKARIPQNVFGGNSRMVKMNFVSDYIMLTDASPAVNTFSGQTSFRLNNVNLPYVGQASGQALPQGYTSAATAFRQFKVLGAKIFIEAYDPTDDCQVGFLVTSSGDTETLQGVTVNKSDMINRCQVKPLSATGERKTLYKAYYKIGALEGAKSAFNTDVAFYSFLFNNSVASAATDEAGTTGELIKKKVPKVHVALAPNNTTQVGCKIKVNIIYYTYCWGKLSLATSTSAE